METRVGARIASSVRAGHGHAQTRVTSTRTPASIPTGGSTKGPHKFFLALGLRRADWADKDKRDEYRLAIDKALSKARNLTGIDLKRCWTSYAVEVREDFEDEFKKRLEEYLGYVDESSLLTAPGSWYRLEKFAKCSSSKGARKEPKLPSNRRKKPRTIKTTVTMEITKRILTPNPFANFPLTLTTSPIRIIKTFTKLQASCRWSGDLL